MHLRWSITNPYLIFVGGPDMAPKPPNVRTAPGNPWRSSIARRSFEQYVPPDAHAGEHDHDEEYALERAVGQPPAGQRAELSAVHGAQGDHERGAERDLAGDELADDAGGGPEPPDGEGAAGGPAERHPAEPPPEPPHEQRAARAHPTR